jgi:hypothetical protein
MLDDVIADSKAITAAQSEREKEQEQVSGQAEESSAVLSKDAATKDKTTLLEVLKLLLVRQLFLLAVRVQQLASYRVIVTCISGITAIEDLASVTIL